MWFSLMGNQGSYFLRPTFMLQVEGLLTLTLEIPAWKNST